MGQRIIDLGLDAKFKDMIASIFGQMSDGWWENTPAMEGYWRFATADVANGKVRLVIDTIPSYAGPRAAKGYVSNRWLDMDDTKVRQFLADKIKFLVKGEGLKWDRGNDAEAEYLSYDDPYSVKDCYYAYEVLKGHNVSKHPEYAEASESVYRVTYKTAKGNSAENEVDGDFLDMVIDRLKDQGCTDIRTTQIERKCEERVSYDKLKEIALERLGDATYVDEDDLDDSIMATLDAMPYDIPEGMKQTLAAEIFDELLDRVEESKKHESEDDGWDDWEDVEGLESTIEAIEELAYELRSLVRGSRTRCKTWQDLSDYIVELGDNLSEAGADMKYKTDESNNGGI